MRVRNITTSFRSEYASIAREVARKGAWASPRGEGTYELLNYVLYMDDGRRGTFPTGIGRGASAKVLAAELMQWIGGFSDLAQLKDVSAFFAMLTDDGDRLYGAYGPRTFHGFARAVHIIEADPSTRQGTVSIWNDHEVMSTYDLPCTVSWSFVQRNGFLHMTTYMRSNDVWLGAAYDVPIMCRIQTILAWVLGVRIGSYTHHAQSMHVYERDVESIRNLTKAFTVAEEPPFFDDLPPRTPRAEANWLKIREWAMAAYLGQRNLPAAFQWYSDRLVGTKKNPHFCLRCRYFLPEPCQLH